jgi:parvulin-like peptidyl-prolyl isomerase
VITVLVLAAVGGAAWWVMQRGGIGGLVKPPQVSASAAAMNLALAKTVVATIDGKTVMEAELASLLATGADRAVAIDRYINKVLAAEAARSRYAEDARALSTAAEREVLANLYLQRRNQEILQSVTEEQVAEYYKANVRDEDYASFRLRYYLSRDQADAVNFRSLLDKADKGAQARLAPLGNTGDGFLPFQGIPYGLGQVVRRAKPGEVIGPVTVRDGLLVLVLDEVRSGKKPEIGAVKNEIRALLADRQLTEELLGLRKKANIQLN